jgi:hypothetical protein
MYIPVRPKNRREKLPVNKQLVSFINKGENVLFQSDDKVDTVSQKQRYCAALKSSRQGKWSTKTSTKMFCSI